MRAASVVIFSLAAASVLVVGPAALRELCFPKRFQSFGDFRRLFADIFVGTAGALSEAQCWLLPRCFELWLSLLRTGAAVSENVLTTVEIRSKGAAEKSSLRCCTSTRHR